ncbi:MAG: DUF1446 domain-containing protein [Burkholderiales bacterium]|nr:DUF1446 domain-containing protein [Burkholderiales bacterium]
MKQTMRIGCGAGFQGDRFEPAVLLASQGGLDWLMLECLAERTIALATLARLRDPEAGYDALLERRLATLLPELKKNGVRLITNMGAANPLAAGRRTLALARELGLKMRVAVVTGDEVSGHLHRGIPVMESGRPVTEVEDIVSANAYLGAEALLPAIATGADIIIGGRIADPSLAVAPIAHHFGWRLDDWQRLGAATVVGHLLECAGQVTGGYFADPGKKDVPGLAHLGFPFAAVDADGSALISKVPGTGGLVSAQTVKEQLLYEVTDPSAYITPDVVADFTGVRVTDLGDDRVHVTGGRGRERTPTYKASVGYRAGWLGEGEISYAGPNARARAELAAAIIRERIGEDLPATRYDLVGINAVHRSDFGADIEPYEVRMRVAGLYATRAEAERLGMEVEALGTNGPAGGGGFRRSATERIGVVSALIPREVVRTQVTVFGASVDDQATAGART